MRKLGFESLSRSTSFRPMKRRQWCMSLDRSTGRTREARDTRAEVSQLLAGGLPYSAISARLGVSKSTVAYHAKRLGLASSPAWGRRYDWAQGQAYYDAGHSISERQERFGFARRAWAEAARRGALIARPQATPLHELLTGGAQRSRSNIKRRLVAAGLKHEACEECGLTEWRGRQLSFALHHINGVRN